MKFWVSLLFFLIIYVSVTIAIERKIDNPDKTYYKLRDYKSQTNNHNNNQKTTENSTQSSVTGLSALKFFNTDNMFVSDINFNVNIKPPYYNSDIKNVIQQNIIENINPKSDIIKQNIKQNFIPKPENKSVVQTPLTSSSSNKSVKKNYNKIPGIYLFIITLIFTFIVFISLNKLVFKDKFLHLNIKEKKKANDYYKNFILNKPENNKQNIQKKINKLRVLSKKLSGKF